MALNRNGQSHKTLDHLCRSPAAFLKVGDRVQIQDKISALLEFVHRNRVEVHLPLCAQETHRHRVSCAFCLCHGALHGPTWPCQVPHSRVRLPVHATGNHVLQDVGGVEQNLSLGEDRLSIEQTAEVAEAWQWWDSPDDTACSLCASVFQSWVCYVACQERRQVRKILTGLMAFNGAVDSTVPFASKAE